MNNGDSLTKGRKRRYKLKKKQLKCREREREALKEKVTCADKHKLGEVCGANPLHQR